MPNLLNNEGWLTYLAVLATNPPTQHSEEWKTGIASIVERYKGHARISTWPSTRQYIDWPGCNEPLDGNFLLQFEKMAPVAPLSFTSKFRSWAISIFDPYEHGTRRAEIMGQDRDEILNDCAERLMITRVAQDLRSCYISPPHPLFSHRNHPFGSYFKNQVTIE